MSEPDRTAPHSGAKSFRLRWRGHSADDAMMHLSVSSAVRYNNSSCVIIDEHTIAPLGWRAKRDFLEIEQNGTYKLLDRHRGRTALMRILAQERRTHGCALRLAHKVP